MRNVVYSINLSIDGCCGHTHFNPDEALFEYINDMLRDIDLSVYGRITYELMFPYWSDVAKAQSEARVVNEFAQLLTDTDKIVFSKTLDTVEGNARIFRDNLKEEVLQLKQQPGKKISIDGVNLMSQLIGLDVIDEFYFFVHPTIVGQGRRLLEGNSLPEQLNLKLVECKHFKSGCLGLHYMK